MDINKYMLIIYNITKVCYNLNGDVMRLRNVRGSSEVIYNSSYVVKNYEEYKGKYNKVGCLLPVDRIFC